MQRGDHCPLGNIPGHARASCSSLTTFHFKVSKGRAKHLNSHTMKKTLCILAALLASPFLPLTSAAEKTFPDKNPVLRFEIPQNWKSEADPKDGSFAMESVDGRIAVHLAPLPVEASLEVLEKILPDMLKELKDATVVEKPKEHTEEGLTGYIANYNANIEGKPALCIFVLFKGAKDQSVLGTIFVGEPGTLAKEDGEAMGKFMNSMKAPAK